MSRLITEPLTPGLMRGFDALRNLEKSGVTSSEINELRARIRQAYRNAEALYVLFGGIVDESAVEECVRLRQELDGAYIRAAKALSRD